MNMTHTHVELATVAASLYAQLVVIHGQDNNELMQDAINMAERLLTLAAERKRQQISEKPFVSG